MDFAFSKFADMATVTHWQNLKLTCGLARLYDVVAAPQVVYLSARLGFTLRDDTISYVMKP